MARPMRVTVVLLSVLLGTQVIVTVPVAAQPSAPPPQVIGLALADARGRLLAWDPQVNISVTPLAGPVPPGTDLLLAVVTEQQLSYPSPPPSGPEPIPAMQLWVVARVPDLVGRAVAAADDLIVRSGLRAAPSSTAPPPGWVVVSQLPPPGTHAKWNEPVTIVFGPAPPSSSSQSTLVEVPDLRGQSEDQARATAARAGLRLDVHRPGAGPGQPMVTGQDPAAGTRVPRGSTVSVALAVPKPASTGTASPKPALAVIATAVIVSGGSVLGLLMLLLFGLWLTRRRRWWVRRHVRARLRTAGSAPSVRVDSVSAASDTAVTILRRGAPPDVIFEEERP